MNKIRIVKIPNNKWKEFRNLILKSLKDDPLAFIFTHKEALKISNKEWQEKLKYNNYLFAKKEEKLVGLIGYHFEKYEKTKHVANVFNLYLNPEFRGQNIGNLLIKSAITKIKTSARIKKINLHVCKTQKSAIQLYIKFGFKITGKLEKEFKMGNKFFDVYYLEKIL